jgi:putative DNA methylase
MNDKKKLIEVALPLDIINEASSKEKSIRQGHPVTLHQWWARRPLAASSAIIYSSIIDDPSNYLKPKAANKERKRLFKVLSDHIQWQNYSNLDVIHKTRQEILKSTNNNLPSVYDPFTGGGSIPLEAQRLGLKAFGSDLNPVAVLISKTLVEILPKFRGRHPIHKSIKISDNQLNYKNNLNGFIEDFNHYAEWVLKEAEAKIGYLFPKTNNGKIVIAWLWARTVCCSNPACKGNTPLLRSFLIGKKGNKKIWIEPIIDNNKKSIDFKFHIDTQIPPDPLKTGRGAKFRCIFCNSLQTDDYIKKEGKENRISKILIGSVVIGGKGQEYVDSKYVDIPIVEDLDDLGNLETELNYEPRAIWCPLYGLERYRDLFTNRQLKTLITFSEIVKNSKQKIISDGLLAGISDDGVRLSNGGKGLTAYSEAIATFLAFIVDRCSNYWSTLTPWGGGFMVQTFSRQGLPMIWDYAEANPFSKSTGSYSSALRYISKVIERCICDVEGKITQLDAATSSLASDVIICTDPPYYDNIGYADLSDFFYIWLRRMLIEIYPDLFSTLLVPKNQEIVASQYRFNGDKDKARNHFINSLNKAFIQIKNSMNDNYPFTLFYAFKQTENEKNSDLGKQTFSTGWETMLTSLIDSGFYITGTWPIRTERPSGMKHTVNALASSIVLVCRRRLENAPIATRREFVNALKNDLPFSLKNLQESGIAPVDMAQSAIGPGMAVFSKFSKVLEADGTSMSIRTALQIINQQLDSYLVEQESDMDKETRFCVSWYEQYGWQDGPFGDANTLATAKGTAVNALEKINLITAKSGKVRLLSRNELDEDWDPTTKKRIIVWECVQYLIKTLNLEGESGSAEIIRKIGGLAESVKELSYRLYSLCEKQGRAEEAMAYNSLISSWKSIVDRAQFGEKISKEDKKRLKDKSQKTLFDNEGV